MVFDPLHRDRLPLAVSARRRHELGVELLGDAAGAGDTAFADALDGESIRQTEVTGNTERLSWHGRRCHEGSQSRCGN